MEEESFDKIEIAKLLNQYFIPIKVDRERRPDIDEFYGNAMMYFIGQQGWPMSLFLTPEGKPFDGGGYYSFKKFKALLLENADYWKNRQQEARQDADKVMSRIRSGAKINAQAEKLDKTVRRRAIKDLLSIVDNYNGGFGEGSKFPKEPWLLLLLNDSYGKSENNDSLVALNNTLTHIGRGGIYDQLAGGFHRYATDPYWKVPHFEKMLYDQALLIRLYLQANVIQPNPFFTRLVKQTSDFLLNEMRDPQGGFYSALDADAGGEEGRYYLWHISEWNKVLNKEDSQFFAELFDVDEYGEAYDGRNVLYLASSFVEYAEEQEIPVDDLLRRLDKAIQQLMRERNQRDKPAADKKIIMGWNGLVITALAKSSMHLNNPEYLQAAIDAANFIWTKMRKDKYFYRVHYKGNNSQAALLTDYAFYLQAFLALYDIDKNKVWLDRAQIITDIMLDLFWDKQQGGFFNVPVYADAPLPVRPKSAFDKTLPAGNSVAAQMLIKLYRRTGEEIYKKKANAVFSAFAAEVKEVPSAFSGLLIASHELDDGEKDLPVYGARGHVRIDAFIKQLSVDQYELTVDMQFDDNWHINSHKPFDKQLIPTSIKLHGNSEWQLGNVQYPKHDVIQLGFSRQTLALYRGHVKIKARLKKSSTALNPGINLGLQACNDRLCLPPENLVLYPGLVIN